MNDETETLKNASLLLGQRRRAAAIMASAFYWWIPVVVVITGAIIGEMLPELDNLFLGALLGYFLIWKPIKHLILPRWILNKLSQDEFRRRWLLLGGLVEASDE